jgi:SPOR domain
MADNNRRPYQTRDMGAQRSSEAPPRPQTDDPLAELARLIGQKGPINDPGRDGRNNDERPNPARDLARELAMAMRTPRSAQPEPNVGGSRDDTRSSAGNRAYRGTAEPENFPLRSAEGRRDADGGYRAGNRYEDEGRYEDDGRYEENTRYEDDVRGEEDARYENSRYRADDRNSNDDGYAADNRYRDDGSEHDSSQQDGHYDYDEDGHDYSDDHAYADDEAYAAGEYADDGSGERKRGGFLFVATIFGLAVLGTAGAFGYRAMFGGSIAPSLPPIIKAEDGPNKIIPAASAQSGSSGQADATNNDSNDKLVSREEQPVNIQAAPTTAPRMVSTVPVFPDSAPGMGPGSAAAGYPIGAMASGGPAFAGSPNSAASIPTGSVPTPAPAADPGPAAKQPAPAPMAAAPAPAASATKKIHTVAIRTDQSDAQDATSTPPQRASKPSSAADANAPLSIVPGGGETAAPAAPVARPRSTPTRPAPVNTAAAATNDAPAPAPAGGGYAVQVSSQHSEAEVQDSFRALQAKYPDVLGGKQPIIRRADLGAKGIYYRALVGPFASAEEAASMCSSLKAAGGSCLVQKN